jgi:hypothetical protein
MAPDAGNDEIILLLSAREHIRLKSLPWHEGNLPKAKGIQLEWARIAPVRGEQG